MLKYSINIAYSDEDKGYIATIPEFKNLSAFGETYEKALKEAKIAAAGYIESLRAENLPIPAPRTIPAPRKTSKHSDKIRLRMPEQLHQDLAACAAKQGMSLNSYMVFLLSREDKKEKEMYNRLFITKGPFFSPKLGPKNPIPPSERE